MKRLKNKIFIAAAALVLTISVNSTPARADYYSDNTKLSAGMRSSEVVNLQNDLKVLGYFGYNSTGYFGSLTTQSVKEFQADNWLYVDGIVGKNTSRAIKVDKVIATAKQQMGIPYVWGGSSRSGFDCSGFTSYVLAKNGITVPRTAALQYNSGTVVSKSNLKPGDLVFFATYTSGPSHVGIYLGNNQFIHASSGAGKVTISNITTAYYAQRYLGARRVI